jgi:hypothetical protein
MMSLGSKKISSVREKPNKIKNTPQEPINLNIENSNQMI